MATIQKLSYTAKEIDKKLGMVDSLVKTVNGIAPDENGDVEIVVPSGGGSGLTKSEKDLILTLFRNTAYTANMSETFSKLEDFWNGGSDEPDVPDVPDEPDAPVIATYSITNNLTGVVSSNDATTINEGESYSSTLTIIEGYTRESIVITMGGIDITDTAYGDGYITIYEVNGDIEITAIAILPAPVYELATALECDGTQEAVDTGITLMDDSNESFTIMIDYELPEEVGLVGYAFGCPHNGVIEKALCIDTSTWYGTKPQNAIYFNSGAMYLRDGGVYKLKVIITYAPDVGNNIYYVIHDNGEKQAGTIQGSYGWMGQKGFSSVLLAAAGFKGTINRFKIYDRVVIEDEINEFLGCNK